MKITKTAVVTIAGRPNVGKSTLANKLAGEKVAIVSNKPQTTRNKIYAVCNREDTQLVFLDTPGYHKPRTALGEYMVKLVKESLNGGEDAIILMVEPIPRPGAPETELIEMIKTPAFRPYSLLTKSTR